MNPTKATRFAVYTSLFFAVLIILASKYLNKIGYSQNYIFVLVALWFLPFMYFSKRANPEKEKKKKKKNH